MDEQQRRRTMLRYGLAAAIVVVIAAVFVQREILSSDDEVAVTSAGGTVALGLLDASQQGGLDPDGAIDLFAKPLGAELLGVDARALLLEIAAGDDPLDPDAKPELVVHDVLAWFERRARTRKQRNTTQRLREASGEADAAVLLAEKQRELEANRARAAAHKAAGAPR